MHHRAIALSSIDVGPWLCGLTLAASIAIAVWGTARASPAPQPAEDNEVVVVAHVGCLMPDNPGNHADVEVREVVKGSLSRLQFTVDLPPQAGGGFILWPSCFQNVTSMTAMLVLHRASSTSMWSVESARQLNDDGIIINPFPIRN